MTTELRSILLLAGISEDKLEMVEDSAAFREFLLKFNTVENIAYQLVTYAGATEPAAIGIANRIHRFFVGHPKRLKEHNLGYADLTFAREIIAVLALREDQELLDNVHGLGKRGIELLSLAFTRAWTVFLTEKFIDEL